MRRRDFLVAGAVAAASVAAGAPRPSRARQAVHDLVLRNGIVIDGTGSPRFRADVAISGDRVVRIEGRVADQGAHEVDCSDHVIAPGFVDIHSHADGSLFADPMMESVVRQGVTTVVIGADGTSRAPAAGEAGTMKALLDSISRLRPGANVASCVGLGSVRGTVVGGGDRPATPAQVQRMAALVERALAEGAAGASSGLEYLPGTFATREELVALCRPLAARGLAYHTHMRNEDDRLIEAIDEAIGIAREAGCALQVSHLKTQGPRNWGRLGDALACLEEARAAGLDVAFDRYPYLAYSTGLTSLFPSWSRAQGIARMVTIASAPESGQRLRTEVLAKVELIGGWDNVQITTVAVPADKASEGQRLGTDAAKRGVEPYEHALGLLRRSSGNVGMVGFAMSEENLERILRHDLSMVASDGGALATSGPARRGVPHPRGAGTFARVLGRYVRERGVLTLEQAVRKLSALPAARMRFDGRGTLAEGGIADVVVFDPATVNDRATFEDPFQYAVGIKATIVNGGVAFEEGVRGARTGRAVMPRHGRA